MHTLIAQPCPSAALPGLISGSELAQYEAHLRDESRLTGQARCLAFPRTAAEVAELLRFAAAEKLNVTVSAARTGITAGAVPVGGLLISLERMNRICGLRRTGSGEFRVRCEAGVILADLQKAVRLGRFPDSASWDDESRRVLAQMQHGRHLYPPDPTETSASIGGTVACNASGAHTFAHGPTRNFVTWLEIVLADGSRLEVPRGQFAADSAGRFRLERADGSTATVTIPTYRQPQTKNAAGYFTAPGMDLLDLFIGAEATLGIITQVELRLIPAPETSCAVVTFWPDDRQAIEFTLAVRAQRQELGLEAIEYFDPLALNLLRAHRHELGAASGIPECLPAAAASAIYLDLGTSASRLRPALETLAAAVRKCGGDPELCWSALEKEERERLRLFRHALPEIVNSRIGAIRQRHPTVTKLGTDMAVPDAYLEHILAFYRARLDPAGLDYVIFGHIGDNHLHVNILPRNPEEYAAGKKLYAEFAAEVVRCGGSPAAEHGIGRLKTGFLALLYGADGVAQMRTLKAAFDPDFRLAPGVWFEQEKTARREKEE